MPYKYIEHVLTGNERVLFFGHFPWIYKINAVFYLIMGIGACCAFLLAGIWFNVDGNYKTLLEPRNLATIIETQGGFITAIRDSHMGFRIAGFVSLFIGTTIFANMLIAMMTTEIAITSYRLIYKTGIIARNVGEMNLNRVESVHVTQSILGRLLNFGQIEVRGMGIGDIQLPILQDPLALRRAIELATRDRTDSDGRR